MVVRGAQRAGCGIVFLATSEGAAPAVDLELTEALVYGVAEDEEGYMGSAALEEILEHAGRASALVMGPGTGTGDEGRRLVEGILREVESARLARRRRHHEPRWHGRSCAERIAPTVITPHAGELGRLLGSGAKEVSAHRLDSARKAAEQHRCCVLLKGSDTLVVEGEKVAVNSTGNVALAAAGTGDVLSGVIGALLSRGMDTYEAARAGAWVARTGGRALARGDRLARGEHRCDRSARLSCRLGRGRVALRFRLALRRGRRRARGMLGGP